MCFGAEDTHLLSGDKVRVLILIFVHLRIYGLQETVLRVFDAKEKILNIFIFLFYFWCLIQSGK